MPTCQFHLGNQRCSPRPATQQEGVGSWNKGRAIQIAREDLKKAQ